MLWLGKIQYGRHYVVTAILPSLTFTSHTSRTPVIKFSELVVGFIAASSYGVAGISNKTHACL